MSETLTTEQVEAIVAAEIEWLEPRFSAVLSIAAELLALRKRVEEWAGSAPFITSESGGGEYAVRVKVHSMDELHAAHTLVLKAFGANL